MNARYIVPLLIVVASAGAPFSTAGYYEHDSRSDQHTTIVKASASRVRILDDQDHVAATIVEAPASHHRIIDDRDHVAATIIEAPASHHRVIDDQDYVATTIAEAPASHHRVIDDQNYIATTIVEAPTSHRRVIDHNDQAAIKDMMNHAAAHLGTVTAVPESYVTILDWKLSWTLRWIDFDHGGHTVRIYHATHDDLPQTRFVIAVDESCPNVFGRWSLVE